LESIGIVGDIKWKWQDLLVLGSGTHFEALNIAGTYGLLTGSYGYGALDHIIVDPTLTVSESVSELSFVNTWDGSSSGYNFTILQLKMVLTASMTTRLATGFLMATKVNHITCPFPDPKYRTRIGLRADNSNVRLSSFRHLSCLCCFIHFIL